MGRRRDWRQAVRRRGHAWLTAINLAEALDVVQPRRRVRPQRLDEVIGPLVAESLTLLAVDERA